MSFISQLRDRDSKKIKHPVSFGFSPENWIAAFQSFTDGSARDRNVKDFGLFLFQRMEKVRQSLHQLELQTPLISEADVRDRIVRYLNKSIIQLQIETVESIGQRNQIFQEELNHLRLLKSHTGASYSPQEVLESMVDASRHVLRSSARKAKGYGSKKPQMPIWDVDESLMTSIHFAHMYDHLENQWQDVLWGEVEFTDVPHGRSYFLSEKYVPFAQEAAIDLARRKGKYGRDIGELKDLKLAESTFDELIIAIASDGDISVKSLRDFSEDERVQILSLAYQRYAITENSSYGLLNSPHGKMSGVTIKMVFDAWLQLSFIAAQCCLRVFGQTSDEHQEKLIVPLSTERLTACLSQVLAISLQQASEIISYLSYDAKIGEQSIWHHPLFPSSNYLLLAWYPLLAFHPMRLLAHWANEDEELKNVHAKKGFGFEGSVVNGTLLACAKSGFQELPFVIGPGLDIADPSIGDIDALLLFGDTAFVLECRNLSHPATAYEFWTTAEELRRKIPQAIRKRDYLNNNPDVLNALIKNSPFGKAKRNITNVVAVVVSNSYLFEGKNLDEPYFVHEDTLFNTILTRGVQFGDCTPQDELITLQVNSFPELKPDGKKMVKALAHPPKAEFYRRCLSLTSYPLMAIDQTEPIGVYAKWAFNPPTPGNVKKYLEKCSFASEIVESKEAKNGDK